MLKHLPKVATETLLRIFNDIWQSGDFPPTWHEATVVPIPKPGKDPSNPTNYRPISLTSCLCKTFERLVNARLVWYLEKNALSLNTKAAFENSEVLLTSWSDSKHSLKKQSSERNTWYQSLIWRRRTIPRGNMVFY